MVSKTTRGAMPAEVWVELQRARHNLGPPKNDPETVTDNDDFPRLSPLAPQR